jgi:hypothetical protein
MKIRPAAIGIAVGFSGCASYYTAPDGAATAKLAFVTDMRPVMVQRFEDVSCSESKKGIRLAYIDPTFGSRHGGPVLVEADKELIFTVAKKQLAASVMAGSTCMITTRFVPKAGEEYEVHFLQTPAGCSESIFRVLKDASGVASRVPETTASKLEKTCYTVFD